MKQTLKTEEQQRLDKRVAEVEQRTGSQVVLAVVERSDTYPEVPWKAFALAAAGAGFASALVDRYRASWHAPETTLIVIAVTLIAGAAAALLAVIAPAFGRFFLDNNRAEAETRQYAESLFLKRELFATAGRSAVLLFVSLFEREVVVLPDTGLAKRLGADGLSAVVARMTPELAAGRVAAAMEQGLSVLEELLSPTAPKGQANNELPDAVVQEKGA